LQDAGSITSKDYVIRAVRCNRGVRVVVSVQNLLEVALDDTTLGAQVLNHSLAAAD
jgi:hypothetical protein